VKVDTEQLSGAALDWAVLAATGRKGTVGDFVRFRGKPNSEIVGYGVYNDPPERDEFGMVQYQPSENWAQAGPLIAEDHIGLAYSGNEWVAFRLEDESDPYNWDFAFSHTGRSPLEAAMRCFVYSKLGSEVEFPEELSSMLEFIESRSRSLDATIRRLGSAGSGGGGGR
jgi:hypothetical protein